MRPLPAATNPKERQQLPKIQSAHFPPPNEDRAAHREAVKAVFTKCWAAYRAHAWRADELLPVTGYSRNPFGGWGATLVDALDTLWLMELHDEFRDAADAAVDIDFTESTLETINVFETCIRYLGGFLAAYDLSGDARLLRKAVEVGEMLYKAFDTPNRMPMTRWPWRNALEGKQGQEAEAGTLLAEIGSLSLEFTRLSILTGDEKWFDATERITELLAAQQRQTELEGMWPMVINAQKANFRDGSHFTLGSMADSMYEYLPKMAALLGGGTLATHYQRMYELAADTATEYLLFRPLTPDEADILVAGSVDTSVDGDRTYVTQTHQAQHLGCYTGGMYALGGAIFKRQRDLDVAAKLTDGCLWAYRHSRHGVMPESFSMAACPSIAVDNDAGAPYEMPCPWDELAWKKQVVLDHGEGIAGVFDEDLATAERLVTDDRLPRGFTVVKDARYILRPEAIESVFVLYRVTGRADLVEDAWNMFVAVDKMTSTRLANSAVRDVMTLGRPGASDEMESFWLGETLKYFYLIFCDEDVLSLDEWVFNTEAHPFRRLG